MRTSEQMVTEFHEAAGHPVGSWPLALDQRRLELRMTLIGEEVAELVAALAALNGEATEALRVRLVSMFRGYAQLPGRPVPNLAAVGKEACDVHVVVSGTCVEAGIPEDRIYEEAVHPSNMAKAGGPMRPDGKSLKPEGWQPPDVEAVLHQHVLELSETRGV